MSRLQYVSDSFAFLIRVLEAIDLDVAMSLDPGQVRDMPGDWFELVHGSGGHTKFIVREEARALVARHLYQRFQEALSQVDAQILGLNLFGGVVEDENPRTVPEPPPRCSRAEEDD